ncbi:MAG: NYN domain-containing protein [Synergistaceae bacterium]|jgi:uncharacterized LabA/DUF88 family protein|nr:NYN domain-containing protein [Synergistaceae bacterium]
MEMAFLIDGAFIRSKFHSTMQRDITAIDVQNVVKNVLIDLKAQDIQYRVYFYDCPPYSGKTKLPITHTPYDFEATPQYSKMLQFLKEVKLLPFFAVREGVLSFQGWILKKSCYGMSPLTDNCFSPNLKQKGVDIKIGLDVAWVSFNKIAANIVLITGDSDFIPVVKTARRSGVFVYLFTLGHNVKTEFCENVDVANTRSLDQLVSSNSVS